jgi:hypothetical protein
MSQQRIDLFVAACLSGIMGHARSDNPPEVIAARALSVAIACDKACDEAERAEDERESAESDALRDRIAGNLADLKAQTDEAAELAALEAATRPEN